MIGSLVGQSFRGTAPLLIRYVQAGRSASSGFNFCVRIPPLLRVQSRNFGSAADSKTDKSQATGDESKATGDKSKASGKQSEGAESTSKSSEDSAKSDQSDQSTGKKSSKKSVDKEKSEAEQQRTELEDLTEQMQAKRKRLLLALANFENDKKRFMRERTARTRRATVAFGDAMIDALEEFDRLPEFDIADGENPSRSCQTLQQGVTLTRELFVKILKKHGVEQFSAEVGTPAVVTRHEIVERVENSEVHSNTITEALEMGWAFKPKTGASIVIRKPKVNVSCDTPPPPPSKSE